MRSFYARGVAVALSLASLANVALAQDAGYPSLLPLPPAYSASYPVAQTAATDVLWNQGETSPVPPAPMAENLPSPSDQHQDHSVISPDSAEAIQGYAGCGDVYSQTSCCNGFYAYGNALWMTREKRGGFVTSIDSVTNSPRLFFCAPNYGDLWYGGFEVGAGWCLGGCCNDPCGGCCQSCPKAALEFTYWGINTPDEPTGPSDPLISMIDFSDLDYNGAGMETIWSPAEHHELQFGYSIHSVEVNLVGNCSQNGPFGCQRVGACGGCGGSRWGFGWMAGLRYIDYSEDFLFSTDFDDSNPWEGDADEAHYEVDLDNNLFGFQLGGGLNLCLTRNVSAYATGRMGIYNNYVEQTQLIYGPAGPVTINNGPYNGDEFYVNSTDNDLAIVGQFDLGARWSVTNHWSIDLGYRVVGLSGVAIAEDNVQRGNFQNLDGIADTQTQGSVLLHGGYLGATFAW